MRKLAALATAALLAGCGSTSGDDSAGGSDAAEGDPPSDTTQRTQKHSDDAQMEPPPGDTDKQWSVGEKRIVEYESWMGGGTGKIAQVEVELLGVDIRRERCVGPRNPVAVLLKLRVENVGPTVANLPEVGGYWLSSAGRRVDDPGCVGTTQRTVPTLKPGEWAVGVERAQVPVESGWLIVETAYPFVDSRISLATDQPR